MVILSGKHTGHAVIIMGDLCMQVRQIRHDVPRPRLQKALELTCNSLFQFPHQVCQGIPVLLLLSPKLIPTIVLSCLVQIARRLAPQFSYLRAVTADIVTCMVRVVSSGADELCRADLSSIHKLVTLPLVRSMCKCTCSYIV